MRLINLRQLVRVLAIWLFAAAQFTVNAVGSLQHNILNALLHQTVPVFAGFARHICCCSVAAVAAVALHLLALLFACSQLHSAECLTLPVLMLLLLQAR
jgi:hypothetical protein